MGVRSQRVYVPDDASSRALELVGSDGRICIITKQDIQTFYQSTSGNAASRRTQVIQFIKNKIVTDLGSEQIDINKLDYDFSLVDGSIITATVG